jgi:hypothetical protein
MPFALVTLGILAMLVAGLQPPKPLRGVVTDAGGRPLAGVAVSGFGLPSVRTAADGSFDLPDASLMVRFHLPGYQPVTRYPETVSFPLVMRPATSLPRVVPRCAPDVPPAMVGWSASLKLRTPKGVKHRRGQDDEDYGVQLWSHRGAHLRQGAGVHWSYGGPLPQMLAKAAEFEELDVQIEGEPDLWLTDIRGRRADGTRFRFVGTFGETLEYEDASPQATETFDRMLDAMCYRTEESKDG